MSKMNKENGKIVKIKKKLFKFINKGKNKCQDKIILQSLSKSKIPCIFSVMNLLRM